MDTLLTTKFYVPILRHPAVVRPQLLTQLNTALRVPSTLVSAPSGFGKSTLVSTWIQHLRTTNYNLRHEGDDESGIAHPLVAWLTLDNDDNDPIRFLRYCLAALQIPWPTLGAAALALLTAPQPSPPKTILTLLLNDCNRLDSPLLLVLDDYHLITEPLIHEALTFLIDHLPANLHLIITTRVDPPLPLARWRVRNQLGEIRSADLRFTANEAATFLNQIMALQLPPSAIDTLVQRTEGWIAGLQLAALSLQNHSAPADFIAHFTGSHAYIVDYLVEEVLQQQPEAVRHFLLQTAVLERLCGPLCEAVTGQANGQVQLEQLQRANLFLVPLDQERRWFRYHHLFATALRHLLQQQATVPLASLYRRAAAWHAQAGLIGEAVRYALVAEDWNQAADWIEEHTLTLLARGEAATIQSWLATLPVPLTQRRPYLNLARAWLAVLVAQYEHVDEHLQQAELALRRSDAALPPHLSVAEIVGQIAAVRTLVAVHRHDPAQARELGQQALQAIPEQNHYLRAILLYALGLAEWSSDNTDAARRAFAAVSRLGDRHNQPILTFFALNNLAGLQEVQGKLHVAAQTYQQALTLISTDTVSPLPLAGSAYVGLGYLALEWHDLTTAEAQFQLGLGLSQQGGFAVSEALAWFGLALTAHARGDWAGRDKAGRQAEEIVASWQQGPPAVHTGLYQARLALARHDLAAAAACCQNTAGHLPQEWRTDNAILQARIGLLQGQAQPALTLLHALLPLAEQAERGRQVIEILVLQALAESALGANEAALTALARALRLAESEGYLHLFIDQGAVLIPLLHKVAARGIAMDYVQKLLALLEAVSHPSPSSSPGVVPLIEPLSERELAVLRLLALGLKNQAIADELVVVLGTVKAHINHIYAKLGVENRVQAIARARELRLL